MSQVEIAKQTLATLLASLIFWIPFSTTVARAQDLAPVHEAIEAEVDDGIARDLARDQTQAVDGQAPAKALTENTGIDWSSTDLAAPDESGTTPVEGTDPAATEGTDEDPLTPLNLPSGPSKTAVTPQQIALPKGEGSIEGMGESFTPNLSSGTGTFSVPIAVPAGRNGVNPSLSLAYSTAAGNGVVGIGWSLATPFISRQTDKGLPRYRDSASWSEQEDRFMYNGGHELVPVESGDMPDASAPVPSELAGFQQYRARVEGGFMRFFRAPDLTRWVVQSKDGTRFDFGRLPDGSGPNLGDGSVQADPELSTRIFAWYLTRMSDVHGSTVHYQYAQQDGHVYLTDIHYDSPASCAGGNVVARRNCTAPLSHYGRRIRVVYEGREDLTTSYSTTWRVGMSQRIRRIEITSAMGVAGQRYLVRRYHLAYRSGTFHSLLATVQVEGRKSRYDASLGINVGELLSEAALGDAILGDLLPPMRFEYTAPVATSDSIPGFGGIDATVKTSTASPDHSVDEARADLFDVNADGLPDLLVTDPARHEGGAGVYFNGLTADGRSSRAGAFSEGVDVGIPAGLSGTMTLSSLNIVPMDIDGDGKSDLLHMPRERNYGYFVMSKEPQTSRYNAAEGWSFAYIKTALPQGVTDPRIDLGKDTDYIKTLDVNNDHLIDVVKTTGQRVQTWLNLGWLPEGDGRFGSYSADGTLSTEAIESCLPFSGRNLDLSDPGVRIADMNGDGLQDIVQLGFGSTIYFPGRGEGAWGVGSHDCDNSNRSSRHVTMQDPPLDLSTDLAGVHLVDANADGAADLVQISAETMSVWFNRLGTGWTERIVVDGLPFATEAPVRTRIADIDGTGTTDIVYARARKWQWVDTMGGVRPRLLQTVDNGLGALTILTYSTSAEDYLRDLSGSEFDWNSEPLAPGSSRAKCDAKAQARGAGCVHRGGGSPVISTVVRAISTTDRMSALGVADQVTRTEYRYHNAYYEGIEQEFRGFGAADAVALGDDHSPTSITRTFFHQGRRPNEIAADRLADNPNEALKGREYLTETYDEGGNYLSTSHATYAVRSLATGLDGKDISYAYVKRSDELRYDTSAPSAGPSGSLTLEAVVRERAGSSLMAALAAPAREGDAPHTVAVRNPRYARLGSTIDIVDNVGNMLRQTALGRVDKSEAIASHSTAARVDDASCDNTGWLWRTSESWVSGAGDQGQRLKHSQSTFSACGDALTTSSLAELPAQGAFAFAGSAGTASYTQSSQVLVSSSRYDAWGQATESCGGALLDAEPITNCLRYSRVERDLAYGQFVEQEGTATGLNGAALTLLSTKADWDEGLSALVKATDPNGLTHEVFYDGLGRTTGMVAPNVVGCNGKRVPTTRIFYDLTSSPGSRPLSRVHTITELSCSGVGADMLEAYAYVDGLGRPRAVLTEGDPNPASWTDNRGHAWVRSGLTRLTAKGAPAVAYQPDFFELAADQYGAILRNPLPFYTEAYYDAFGRSAKQVAEDGSATRTVYRELSTVSHDALDDAPSERHTGTPTVSYQDGHGREIAQRLHQRHAVGGTDEFHFLFSYYRPDGAVTRVVRARAPETTTRPEIGSEGLTDWVERGFVYDTAGRRIASSDPDTDHRGAPASSKSWRYLFNTVGDLAAVRDPRGCGQNFFYDRAGRLIGEQYVRCQEAQPNVESFAGSVAAGSVGLGISAAQNVHAIYHFDAYPQWEWLGSALPAARSAVLGRATAVADRGQRSAVAYDDRGNAIWGARQMALPAQPASYTASGAQTGPVPVFSEGVEIARPSAFDAIHTYVRAATFDHAGRGLTAQLPSDPDFVSGAAPVVGGSMQYNAAGKPMRANLKVDAATYPVVSGLRYERDGRVSETTYGDGANTGRPSTLSRTEYDVRRRPAAMTTLRAPVAGATPQTLSAVSVVVDQRLEWDRASNLTDIFDKRLGEEWPESHRPQNTHVVHDALYRVEGAYFGYTDANNQLTPVDASSDWRETEARHREADPMHSKAAPRMGTLPSTRVLSLDYEHDWLANTVSWDDDAHSFYERSIGQIVNGNNLSPNASAPLYRPSALYLASNLDPTTPSDKGGYLDLDYGVGGNVLAMTVHARCVDVTANSCFDPGGSDPVVRRNAMRTGCACAGEQHYSYRYDELNRMSEARRFDRAAGVWSLKARQRYRYDSANQRTVKETSDLESDDTRATLYVLPGDFERRGLSVLDNRYAAVDAPMSEAAQGPPAADLSRWFRADSCATDSSQRVLCTDRMGGPASQTYTAVPGDQPTVHPTGINNVPALVLGGNSARLIAPKIPQQTASDIFTFTWVGVIEPSLNSSVLHYLWVQDTYAGASSLRDRAVLYGYATPTAATVYYQSVADYGDSTHANLPKVTLSATVPVGQPVAVTIRASREGTELYLNGARIGNPGPASLPTDIAAAFGSRNERLGEFLMYERDLGRSAELPRLHRYLGERYGIAMQGTNESNGQVGDSETHYMVAGARVVWKNRDPLSVGELDPDHRITFAVGDLIQSTSAVVDLMSGELLEVTGFYPNGAREHWLDSSLERSDSLPLETIGFTGKEADEEVGLTYFGERYLIQRIGRWATPDPLSIHAMGGGEAGNAYHYVSGNLLAGRDPLGLCPEGQSCPDANISNPDGSVSDTNDDISIVDADGNPGASTADNSPPIEDCSNEWCGRGGPGPYSEVCTYERCLHENGQMTTPRTWDRTRRGWIVERGKARGQSVVENAAQFVEDAKARKAPEPTPGIAESGEIREGQGAQKSDLGRIEEGVGSIAEDRAQRHQNKVEAETLRAGEMKDLKGAPQNGGRPPLSVPPLVPPRTPKQEYDRRNLLDRANGPIPPPFSRLPAPPPVRRQMPLPRGR